MRKIMHPIDRQVISLYNKTNTKERQVHTMTKKWIDDIYMTLQGELIPEAAVPGVENLFEEGKPCYVHYGNMLRAYERLCQRLGENEDDPDVEIIISSFMAITNILAKRMFAYGALLGNKEL